MTPSLGIAESLLDVIRAEGGILRAAGLVRRGFTHRVISGLVDRGELIRVRRVWVALPDADALALAAARENVVVSCVTQLQRLGAWVFHDGPAHVAATPHGASVNVTPGTVVHWGAPILARAPGTLFDSVENALVLVATCQPEESALATIESAFAKGLVDKPALLRLPLSRRVRRIVEAASLWSDSGLETFFVVRLRWLPVPVRVQIWIMGHRVDVLIGERLVVQIDGGHHVGAQRTEDIRHDAALMLSGYHVIRVGYEQVVHRWPEVQDMVMRAAPRACTGARERGAVTEFGDVRGFGAASPRSPEFRDMTESGEGRGTKPPPPARNPPLPDGRRTCREGIGRGAVGWR